VSTVDPSLPDKVVLVHRALGGHGIKHAFGGALALAYYAEPRSTIDIDINVFAPVTDSADVLGALAPLGVDTSTPPAGFEQHGQVRVMWGRVPLDLFFAYDPLHAAMARSVRTVPFGADTIPVLSPEHLMICKVVFNRPKDWLDIEQMLLIVDDLQAAEVRAWVERILGSDDGRLTRLDGTVADIVGTTNRPGPGPPEGSEGGG
jgi:hypothetical protein